MRSEYIAQTVSEKGQAAAIALRGGVLRHDALAEYMRSREVYRNKSLVVLVDAFRYVDAYTVSSRELATGGSDEQCGMKPPRVLFFISHFHSDHYSGITRNWRYGVIYASRGTANLLCSRLGVEECYVKKMDMSVTYFFSLDSGDLFCGQTEGNESVEGPFEGRCFSVKLLSANHCPGAVMFLFCSSSFGIILHTGDFRFSKKIFSDTLRKDVGILSHSHFDFIMAEHPALKTVAGKVDVLFLDNTFCDTHFDFPSLADSLRTVNAEIVSMFCELVTANKEEEERKGTLSVAVIIGTYFIGKERIALSIQDTFLSEDEGSCGCSFVPTFVSPEKHAALQQVGFHPERFTPLLHGFEANFDETFDKHAVKLPEYVKLPCEGTKYSLVPFLVPLSSISYRALLAASGGGRLKRRCGDDMSVKPLREKSDDCRRRGEQLLLLWERETIDLNKFDGVICVEPTGWTRRVRRRRINERLILLSVPYSEHCSFSELVDFVEFINPVHIVPTVSVELFKRHEALFAEKAPRLRQRYSNVQPLCRFFAPKAPILASVADKDDLGDLCASRILKQEQQHPFSPAATVAGGIVVDDSDDDSVTSCCPFFLGGGNFELKNKKEKKLDDECGKRVSAEMIYVDTLARECDVIEVTAVKTTSKKKKNKKETGKVQRSLQRVFLNKKSVGIQSFLFRSSVSTFSSESKIVFDNSFKIAKLKSPPKEFIEISDLSN